MERRWIWPFELLDKLGEGGMGVVYRARYVKNDKIVAVKLLPESITDSVLLARFEREMQLLKTLRHPHIVHTFGGTCEGDVRFYAMELVGGGTVDALLLEKGRLSSDLVVTYGLQMCSGLAYAHEKGITHRDVKPGNFLIANDGKIKLADFGLATVAAANKLTATGRTMGTMRYMAPEQIRGKPEPCPQTDIYSLGIVFYELLTGAPPYNADTPAAVLHMHLKEPVPRVAAAAPSVPAALDELIWRMMQKKIEERPASAMDVAAVLRGLEGTVEVAPRRLVGVSLMTPPAPTARPVSAPSSSEVTVRRGLPVWASAVPAGIAVVALMWGCSQRDEVAALQRIETHWADVLVSGTTAQQLRAAEILGEIGPAGSRSEEALLAALEHENPSVRAAAATALGEFGPAGKAASGKLGHMLRQDDRPEVRLAAGDALKKIRQDEK